MSGRNYLRPSVEEFGAHLLRSGDLDPVYIALAHSGFERRQTAQWLIAYWCFYHCGFASWASDAPEPVVFWARMATAAHNTSEAPPGGRWPRGHERRHFRGALALKGLEDLVSKYGDRPEDMLTALYGRDPWTVLPPQAPKVTLKDVMRQAQTHYGFGPWIGFKIADMLDRCLGAPVSFDQGTVFMFDDPEKAALMVWRQKCGMPLGAKPKDKAAVIEAVVSYLTQHFKDFKAPPFEDRPVNVQEVETILCKWKSHVNGHYPLNNDITEINAGLSRWAPFSPAASRFLKSMPGGTS